MKNTLTHLLFSILIGFLPFQANAQTVLPAEAAVLHYKTINKRISSHSVQQVIPQGNGDTTFHSYLSLVDSAIGWSIVQWTKPVTGFPLGNALTKTANGNWTSLTADGALLQWAFTTTPQSWTVFQDSVNHLTAVFIGTDTITHFSENVTVWKYNLSSTGPRFSWVNQREIWLSAYGVLRCPDFRSFPYETTAVILTGYDSPTTKKGLFFRDSTYAPYTEGDTIAFSNAYYPNPYVYSAKPIYFIDEHKLISLESTTYTSQTWLADTRRYKVDSGIIVSDSAWSNNMVHISTLPYESGRIISIGNNVVVLVFDSLPFEQNPDSYFERTYAQIYTSNGTLYYQFKQGSSSLLTSFSHTDFRGDWGFNSYKLNGVTGRNSSYLQQVKVCTYRTVGPRRLGSPPQTSAIAEELLLVKPLLSYPNPATDLLTIEDESMENKLVQIHIYNSEGRLMRQLETKFPVQLDLTAYAAGIYSARIIGPAGYYKYTRFIKVNR